MTQYALPVIDPNVTTGTDLANYLNSWKPALLSQHAGAARPAYAVGGMLWVETVSASVWNLKLFGGTLDATIGTINPTTGVFTMGGTTFASLTVTGNTVLGDAPADTLTVNATPTFTAGLTLTGGDILVSRSAAGGTVIIDSYNSNNASATADACLRARVAGSGSGDPRIELLVTAIQGWSVGIDNSDGDKFKISANVAVGTATALTIEPSGIIIANNGTLHVGSNAVSTGDCVIELGMNRTGNGPSYLDFHSQAGTDYDGRILRGAGANAALAIDNNGTGGILCTIAGVNFFHIGSGATNISNRPFIVNGSGVNQALQIFDSANAAGAQISLYGNGGTNPNKFIRSCLGTFEIIKSDYSAVILALGDTGALGIGGASGGTGFTAAGSFVQPLGAGIKSRSAYSAWVRHDGAGTIIRSFNCATVTKNSAGSFTYTWTAGVMADGSYGYFATAKQAGTVIHVYIGAPAPTASQLVVQCVDHNGVATDPAEITCGILP